MTLDTAKIELFINFILGNKFATGVAISVTSGVATVTSPNHGLIVGEFVQIIGATPDGLRGNKIILSVPDGDTFTYDAVGIIDGVATGVIAYISGLVKVYRGKQDEGQPVKPYVWFRISSSVPYGQALELFEDSGLGLKEISEQKRTITLELNFHTKTEQQAIDPLELSRDPRLVQYVTANALADQFQNKSKLSRSRRFQKLNGFSVLSVQTISDVDEYVGDRWERRAICELSIFSTSIVTETVESYNPNNLTVTSTIKGL